MVTTVVIPPEKTRTYGAIKDVPEHISRSRNIVERVSEFINDDSRKGLINWGFGLQPDLVPGPEIIARLKAQGIGTTGIFTSFPPADLKLYKSLLPRPLKMPAKPEVTVAVVDYHSGNFIERYQEGWVTIKALCPDGQESSYILSMPVTNLLMCYLGVAWGIPKYMSDQMTVSSTHCDVRYENEVMLSFDFTPQAVKNEKELFTSEVFGTDNSVTFHPYKGGTKLVRFLMFTRKGNSQVLDWQAGTVKVAAHKKQPWAGLIPDGLEVNGVYQWYLSLKDQVWQKVEKK